MVSRLLLSGPVRAGVGRRRWAVVPNRRPPGRPAPRAPRRPVAPAGLAPPRLVSVGEGAAVVRRRAAASAAAWPPAAGFDRRTIGQACPVSLASATASIRRSFARVWQYSRSALYAGRKREYQSVWPGNCWRTRLFRLAGHHRPDLGKNVPPRLGAAFPCVKGSGGRARRRRLNGGRQGLFFLALPAVGGVSRGRGSCGTPVPPPCAGWASQLRRALAQRTAGRPAGPAGPGPSPAARGRGCCRAAGPCVVVQHVQPGEDRVERQRRGLLRQRLAVPRRRRSGPWPSSPAQCSTIRSRQ